ncbi:hypothetical protein BKA80DRAFT_259195 [Phyllosticta citrichinensis]
MCPSNPVLQPRRRLPLPGNRLSMCPSNPVLQPRRRLPLPGNRLSMSQSSLLHSHPLSSLLRSRLLNSPRPHRCRHLLDSSHRQKSCPLSLSSPSSPSSLDSPSLDNSHPKSRLSFPLSPLLPHTLANQKIGNQLRPRFPNSQSFPRPPANPNPDYNLHPRFPKFPANPSLGNSLRQSFPEFQLLLRLSKRCPSPSSLLSEQSRCPSRPQPAFRQLQAPPCPQLQSSSPRSSQSRKSASTSPRSLGLAVVPKSRPASSPARRRLPPPRAQRQFRPLAASAPPRVALARFRQRSGPVLHRRARPLSQRVPSSRERPTRTTRRARSLVAWLVDWRLCCSSKPSTKEPALRFLH